MHRLRYKPYDAAPLAYTTRPIPYSEARTFICQHHYARGMSNAATGTYGLFDGVHLIGVLAFATPCSEAVCSTLFGSEHRRRVTELHRLVILDVTPPNAESYFIARALNSLREDKPQLWGVVSFADSARGHVGTIYQASNGRYYGPSAAHRAYLDPTGRLRSPRQCKENITVSEAWARGWQVLPPSSKHRYAFTLPIDRRDARRLQSLLQVPSLAYPHASTMNGQMRLF